MAAKRPEESAGDGAGMSEPWATLTKLLYYGAYVGVFGRMLLALVERAAAGQTGQ
jgi:hypothetical protein